MGLDKMGIDKVGRYHKINEMIFCSKFIPFVVGLTTLVFVQACRNESIVGAFLDNSE